MLKRFLKSSIILLIGSSILWILLSIYGDFSNCKAFLLALIYMAGIISGAFFLQFSLRFVKEFVSGFQIIALIFTQIIALLILFLICRLFGIISLIQFGEIIPLITVYGLMFYVIMVLRGNEKIGNEKIENKEIENEGIGNEEIVKKDIPDTKKIEERISVKQGTEIHIIKVEEIFYIEAYGDYVLIYTEKNKYIKEQTMLYFETSLPSQFIRIHRSFIINADFMIRLELFGKETYNIRLKNGVSLKASKTGYKLLKERLDL